MHHQARVSGRWPVVHTVMLIAVFFGLGSIAAEAAPITCGYGDIADSCTSTGPTDNTFAFGLYSFELTFAQVNGSFDVTVTDAVTNQSDLTSVEDNRFVHFPGFVCVDMVDPTSTSTPCVDFQVNAPAPGSTTWSGVYNLFIHWTFDTNTLFPNDPGDRIRLLHNVGSIPGDAYDKDITTIGSYTPEQGIGGMDDNFQSFIVAQAPLPEPATLMLLGTGLSTLAFRLRRRRKSV